MQRRSQGDTKYAASKNCVEASQGRTLGVQIPGNQEYHWQSVSLAEKMHRLCQENGSQYSLNSHVLVKKLKMYPTKELTLAGLQAPR